MDRGVQLAAEPAAAGGGNDPHGVLFDAQDPCAFVKVHIGRLGAGGDLAPIAHAFGESRFGLDISMFNKSRLKIACCNRAVVEGAIRRAFPETASG